MASNTQAVLNFDKLTSRGGSEMTTHTMPFPPQLVGSPVKRVSKTTVISVALLAGLLILALFAFMLLPGIIQGHREEATLKALMPNAPHAEKGEDMAKRMLEFKVTIK